MTASASTGVPGIREMLARLISLPSISSASPEWDHSNEGVVRLLAEWLEPLGFTVEIMEVPGMPGKFNLIATLGSGPGGLVLSGHTDTVPFDDKRWQSDPFSLTEKDNRWYGLGTCDMKGFFPLAIEAARAFAGEVLGHGDSRIDSRINCSMAPGINPARGDHKGRAHRDNADKGRTGENIRKVAAAQERVINTRAQNKQANEGQKRTQGFEIDIETTRSRSFRALKATHEQTLPACLKFLSHAA